MNKEIEKPYLMLDWGDIQDMLLGQHPLVLLRLTFKDVVTFNPPVLLEMGDYLSNAEFLCQRLTDEGISLFELNMSSCELYDLTTGLTDVSDEVFGKIVAIVNNERQQGSGKSVRRHKPLVAEADLKPIKRKVPIRRGANYADPTNKAFPLDTPARVRASHAHLHKYWKTTAKSGVTASYDRKKFVEVHNRVLTRMKRLGIQHTPTDTLDEATRKLIKQKNIAKAELKDSQMSSEASNRDEENKYRNMLEVILSEHITFLKNYILAKDTKDEETASVMQRAIARNSKSLATFVLKYILGDRVEKSEGNASSKFVRLWQEYIIASMALAVGSDNADAQTIGDSSLNLSVIKDKLVEFFVSHLSKVAKQKQLDKSFTNWITYMGQYMSSRDKEDVVASFQQLKDWQKSKDEVAGYLAKWIVANDSLTNLSITPEDKDMKKAYDIAYKEKEAKARNQSIATEEKAIVNVPRQGVNATALPDSSASSATVTSATNTNPVTTTVYNPRGAVKPRDGLHGDGTQSNREDGKKRHNVGRDVSGHIPYGSNCEANARTGRCYKRH